MKRKIAVKIIIAGLFLLPLVTFQGCKKQYKCGCGKDIVFSFNNTEVVLYSQSASNIMFYTALTSNSTYYFCNPGQWIDSLNKMNTKQYLLLTGNAFYECNYLMQASNYSYLPPVYQVEVTGLKEDNYGK